MASKVNEIKDVWELQQVTIKNADECSDYDLLFRTESAARYFFFSTLCSFDKSKGFLLGRHRDNYVKFQISSTEYATVDQIKRLLKTYGIRPINEVGRAMDGKGNVRLCQEEVKTWSLYVDGKEIRREAPRIHVDAGSRSSGIIAADPPSPTFSEYTPISEDDVDPSFWG